MLSKIDGCEVDRKALVMHSRGDSSEMQIGVLSCLLLSAGDEFTAFQKWPTFCDLVWVGWWLSVKLVYTYAEETSHILSGWCLNVGVDYLHFLWWWKITLLALYLCQGFWLGLLLLLVWPQQHVQALRHWGEYMQHLKPKWVLASSHTISVQTSLCAFLAVVFMAS